MLHDEISPSNVIGRLSTKPGAMSTPSRRLYADTDWHYVAVVKKRTADITKSTGQCEHPEADIVVRHLDAFQRLSKPQCTKKGDPPCRGIALVFFACRLPGRAHQQRIAVECELV